MCESVGAINICSKQGVKRKTACSVTKSWSLNFHLSYIRLEDFYCVLTLALIRGFFILSQVWQWSKQLFVLNSYDLDKVFTHFPFRKTPFLYLSVSVAVLALLSDPVDGVEVFVGAQSGQRVLQWVHKLTGAVTVHTGCSAAAAAAVLLIASWQGGRGREGKGFEMHIESPASCFRPHGS